MKFKDFSKGKMSQNSIIPECVEGELKIKLGNTLQAKLPEEITNIQKFYDEFEKILKELLNDELKNTSQIKSDEKISKETRDLI